MSNKISKDACTKCCYIRNDLKNPLLGVVVGSYFRGTQTLGPEAQRLEGPVSKDHLVVDFRPPKLDVTFGQM